MQETMATLRKPEAWRYHIQYNKSEKAVNKLGQQGWELVSVDDDYMVFRKAASK
jgi:hypothetical protein